MTKKYFFTFSLLLFIFPITFSQMVTTYQGELGECVAFNVESFTDVRDKTLEDVLKKMPGVSTMRSLSYNGMSVGKIFVNGVDIRSSFTTVAGIKPEEIEKVEFVENYQSVKVLRNKQYSSIAAMNIILKEGSGGDWSGTAKFGMGGEPLLYDGDLYALRIGNNSQSMVNIRADDSGQDLSGSISAFSVDNIGIDVGYFNLRDYLNISPSSSPLSSKRTRFNDSYLVNTVNTFKLSENFQLYTQMSYMHDKTESENSKTKIYYLDADSTIVEESGEIANSTDRQFKTNLALISNTENYYFVNHLLIRADREDMGMSLTGTYPNEQTGEQSSFSIRNDMRFLKPIGDWNLIIYSQNQITDNPQKVFVTRESSQQVQEIDLSSFYSDTKISFGYTSGSWTVSLVGAVDIMNRPLSTSLTGINDIETTDNESDFGYFNTVIQPRVNYVSDRLQLQLGLPVKYYHYWLHDDLVGDNSTNNNTNFEPSFSLKYEVTPLLSFTLNGQIDYDRVNATGFYTGDILTNYRRIEEGTLKYDLDNDRSLGFSFSYKLPQQSLFISGNGGYRVGKSMFRSYDTYIGDYEVVGSILQPTDNSNYYVNVSANKGITSFKGSIGLNLGYTNSDQIRIRNEEEINYNTQVISFSPNVNGRLASWINVVYDFSIRNTIMKFSNSDTKTSSNRYDQTLELILTPTNSLNFSVLGEHYHTIISGGQAKNLVLADFKAEYQVTPKWQVIASVTNILNQKDYSYTVIANLNSTRTSYTIRPRNYMLSLYYKF